MVLTYMLIAMSAGIILLSIILLFLYLQLIKLKRLLTKAEAELAKETEQQHSLIVELVALKEKFEHDVLHDPLTELPGRRVFEDRLIQTFNQCKRYQLTFGVMFLDLDSLKIVNNTLGYEVGDELLKEVAKRLKNSVRQVDTVCRFVGDEFVLILSQLSKPEAAVYVAQRLLDVLSKPFIVKNRELFITASIGIATFPSDGDDPMVLLKNADNALHQAKTRGNCYQFYRPEMHVLSQRELTLSSNLQDSAVYNEFKILYQPQIDMNTNSVSSVNALLCWEHPEYGSLAFQDFSRQADNNGKINEIGDWLIRNVIQQFLKWQMSGLSLSKVAVTVSARQLENPNFAYKLSQLLQELTMQPNQLVLEVSELALLNKLDIIEKVFHMLKHLGVGITIKDFGVGQLSLQHLKGFPVDSLKIASTLVQDISANKDNEAIVKMIAALAGSLQIIVSADGVDTVAQAELLKTLGCYLVQGKLFGSPVLPAELAVALRINNMV